MSNKLNPETASQVLLADVSNILQKAKSGKPLSKYERGMIEESKKAAEAEARAAKKGKKQEEEQVFDSLKAAEAGLGVPKFLLQRAKASGDCADAFRGSRVYVTDNLTLWLEAAEEGGPTEKDKSYWEGACSKQKFQDMVWEAARKRGEYVEKKVFAADLMALGSGQKALIRQKLESEYPGLCPGLEPAQRAELKKLGRALADDISRRMQALVDKWQ